MKATLKYKSYPLDAIKKALDHDEDLATIKSLAAAGCPLEWPDAEDGCDDDTECYAVGVAVTKGRLDVLRWLLEEKHCMPEYSSENDALTDALDQGQVDIADWLTQKYYSYDYQIELCTQEDNRVSDAYFLQFFERNYQRWLEATNLDAALRRAVDNCNYSGYTYDEDKDKREQREHIRDRYKKLFQQIMSMPGIKPEINKQVQLAYEKILGKKDLFLFHLSHLNTPDQIRDYCLDILGSDPSRYASKDPLEFARVTLALALLRGETEWHEPKSPLERLLADDAQTKTAIQAEHLLLECTSWRAMELFARFYNILDKTDDSLIHKAYSLLYHDYKYKQHNPFAKELVTDLKRQCPDTGHQHHFFQPQKKQKSLSRLQEDTLNYRSSTPV